MLEAQAELLPEAPGRITVLSDFRAKDSIKAVPGARWDTTSRRWTIPQTWPACLALRAEFGKGLTIGPGLRAWATEVSAKKAELDIVHTLLEPTATMLAELPTPRPAAFDALYPHQIVDAYAIWKAGSYLLMIETGGGKSRSMAAGAWLLHNSDGIFPALVTCPKSMLITWTRELDAFFPGADVRVVSGTPKQRERALEPGGDFYIIGWELLRSYSRTAGFGSIALTAEEKRPKEIQALGIKTIILDECHRAKDTAAKRTRAAWAAAEDATFRIGATGTPIQDTPEDLYSPLHMLFPDEYPTKTPYVERYLDVDWNDWGGREIKGLHPTRGVEFLANLNTISRRLTKKMVLPWLPDKLHEVRWVTLPPALRKAYNDMEKKLVAELEGSTMVAENNLVRSGRLTQLANSAGDMDADGKYRMHSPSPKVDAFMEDVASGDYDGEQVVIFSDSRELLGVLEEAMTKKKMPYVSITGSATEAERQKAMDSFQAGEVPYFLLTKAGGEGITLTAASTMVRLMRSWSKIIHDQVEDRVHRIGSERHDVVRYVDYISDDTVEMGQVVRLNAKEGRAQEVLRDEELLKVIEERSHAAVLEAVST